MLGKTTTKTGVDLENLISELSADGWQELSAGSFRSNSQVKDYDDKFALFIRQRNFADYLATFLEKSPKPISENGSTMRVAGVDAVPALVSPKRELVCANPDTDNEVDGKDVSVEVQRLALALEDELGSEDTGLVLAEEEGSNEKEEKKKYVSLKPSSHLPVVKDFTNYPSFKSIRGQSDSLVIAYDSEYYNKPREMLSWQFACIYDDILWEFVFLAKDSVDLELELALGRILDLLGFNSVDSRSLIRYDVAVGFKGSGEAKVEKYASYQEALDNAKDHGFAYRGYIDKKHVFDRDMFIPNSGVGNKSEWKYFHRYTDIKSSIKIPVTLVCHAGMFDLTGIGHTVDKSKRNIFKYLMDVQGGIMSSFPIVFAPKSLDNPNHEKIYPIRMDVRDTMGQVPANNKSLKGIGNTLGIPKIDLSDESVNVGTQLYSDKSFKYIEHMNLLLKDNPALFFNYASNDAIVTLLYSGTLYGYNKNMFLTMTSAAAAAFKYSLLNFFDVDNDKDFNAVYRGMVRVKGKKKKTHNGFRNEDSHLEGLNFDWKKIIRFAKDSYMGGYNYCFEYGFIDKETYDYDMQNAYPTVMSLIPDVDYTDPILKTIIKEELKLDDWYLFNGVYNPFKLFFGFVRFEFPDDVMYPCIPIRDSDDEDDIPLFAMSSNGIDGGFCAGPEIYLALRLGAKVYCHEGYFLRPRMIEKDGTMVESRSMAYATKQFVVDRYQAMKDDPEGDRKNMISEVLKLMIVSDYGKIAQGIKVKRKWNAYKDEMEDLKYSSVTNPVSASMITSMVRATLLAAQNELHGHGYHIYSCTTDGFISDAPEDVVKSLNLYGLRPFLETSRIFLTTDSVEGADPEVWEIKHVQDDLLNFTTRGNVSKYCKKDGHPYIYKGKEYDGVCAHNGYVSYDKNSDDMYKGSYKDRLELIRVVSTRTGACNCPDVGYTGFREYLKTGVFQETGNEDGKNIHMDADMKRRILENSLTPVTFEVEGNTYDICNFSTRPFKDVEEFLQWRKKKKSFKKNDCLRTEEELRAFITVANVDYICAVNGISTRKVHMKNPEWTFIMSAVRGHYFGQWEIPMLNKDISDDEKIAWLNKHNRSGIEFKKKNLNDCRSEKRKVNFLPEVVIHDFLEELINDYEE